MSPVIDKRSEDALRSVPYRPRCAESVEQAIVDLDAVEITFGNLVPSGGEQVWRAMDGRVTFSTQSSPWRAALCAEKTVGAIWAKGYRHKGRGRDEPEMLAARL